MRPTPDSSKGVDKSLATPGGILSEARPAPHPSNPPLPPSPPARLLSESRISPREAARRWLSEQERRAAVEDESPAVVAAEGSMRRDALKRRLISEFNLQFSDIADKSEDELKQQLAAAGPDAPPLDGSEPAA